MFKTQVSDEVVCRGGWLVGQELETDAAEFLEVSRRELTSEMSKHMRMETMKDTRSKKNVF